jgi:hypothetical protein
MRQHWGGGGERTKERENELKTRSNDDYGLTHTHSSRKAISDWPLTNGDTFITQASSLRKR